MAATDRDLITFARLTDGQRVVAWAVVRCLTTALWVGVTVLVVGWLVVVGLTDAVAVWSVPPLLATVGLAAALEIKSRDLERPPVP